MCPEKESELPFSGIYLHNMESCEYTVWGSHPSERKYSSGTGWSSFSEVHGISGSDESGAGILRHVDIL